MSKNVVEQVAKGLVMEALGPEDGQLAIRMLGPDGFYGMLKGKREENEEAVRPDLAQTVPVLLGMKLASSLLSDYYKVRINDMKIGEVATAFMTFNSMSKAFWSAMRLRYGLKDVGVGIRLEPDDTVLLVSFPSDVEEGKGLLGAILGMTI